LAATGHKWAGVRIFKGVPRWAVASGKAAGDPVRLGLRDRTSLNVPAVPDSDPAWRIVHNYGRPGTCIPQTGRGSAIGPAWLVVRDSVRVSLE
jgi:hypothetical protein